MFNNEDVTTQNDPVQNSDSKNTEVETTKFESTFDKILTSLETLPPIYINGNIISIIKNYFSKNMMKCRWETFKKNPLNILGESIIPHKAQQYINVASTITDIMFPKSAVSDSFKFVRNVAILDTIAWTLENTIQPSKESQADQYFKMFLKNNGFEQDIKNYTNVVSLDIEVFDILFGGKMADMEVNSTFEGYIPYCGTKFNGKSNVDITLLYKSHKVNHSTNKLEPLDLSYKFLQTTFFVKVLLTPKTNDYHKKVYIYLSYNIVDGNIGCGMSTGYCATEEFQFSENMRSDYSPGVLGMSVFDPEKFGVSVNTLGRLHFFMRYQSDNALDFIVTKKYTELKNEIDSSIRLGYSRSFALVGVPGTGKTDIAWNLIRNGYKNSMVISSSLANNHQVDLVVRLFSETRLNHVIIIADDFDKNVAAKSDDYTHSMIHFFEYMHSISRRTGKVFTLIATINNPSILGNALIKRSERFDEVIKIDPPSVGFISKMMNMSKKESDTTNYRSLRFYSVYAYMHHKCITIADLKNIYKLMQLGKTETLNDKLVFNALDIFKAVRKIVTNKANANENYTL